MKYEVYRFEFYKNLFERDEKGKEKKTGELENLGSVTIDSLGTSDSFPLITKAFRHASQNAQMADVVRTYRLYR